MGKKILFFTKILLFFFSCILAELFTEQPLFTLTQMLDYRTDNYDPMPIVNKIIDVDIRVNIQRFCKQTFVEILC